MMSCQKFTELVEQQQQPTSKLSLWIKLQMKMHFLMCEGCRLYKKQSQKIDKWLTRKSPESQETGLSEQKKQQIIDFVKKNTPEV